ncbi:GATA zinc finger domain-containing protein 4 [Hydra vulgaris]|uniref:GATA zinc finger domain-containing protein 4 n=1 Tax=Hydra vulgaris TaxID=6087 RepID=A0ABM4BFN9_HYDVU
MNANIDDLLMRCSLNKLIKIVEFQKDVLTQQTHYKNILNRYEALFISVINEEKRKNTNVNSNAATKKSGLDRILLNSYKVNEENKFCSDKIRYSNESLNKEEPVKEDLSFKITKSCFNKQELNRPCNMFKESMVQLWERIHYDFLYKGFLDNNFPKRSLSLDSESNFSKKTFYESNFLDHDFSESYISEHSIFNRCFEYDLNVVIDITESFLSDSGFLRKEIFNEEKKTRFYEQAIANEKNLIQEIEFKLLKKHKEKSNVLNSLNELPSNLNEINLLTTDDNLCTDVISIEKILFEINELFNYPILQNLDTTTKRIFFELKRLESSLMNELSSQICVQEVATSNPTFWENTNLQSKQISSYSVNQLFCNTPTNEINNLEKYRTFYLGYFDFSHNTKTEIKKNVFSRGSAIDDNVTPENFNHDNNVTPENFNHDNNVTPENFNHDNNVTPENFNHDNLNILNINISDNQSNIQGNKHNTFDKNDIIDEKVPFTKLSNDRLENYNNRANLENNRKVIKSVLKYFPQSKDNLFGEINPHYSPFWSVIPKNT